MSWNDFMHRHGIPVTRANYIGLNWMGQYTPDNLPPELEAELLPKLWEDDDG